MVQRAQASVPKPMSNATPAVPSAPILPPLPVPSADSYVPSTPTYTAPYDPSARPLSPYDEWAVATQQDYDALKQYIENYGQPIDGQPSTGQPTGTPSTGSPKPGSSKPGKKGDDYKPPTVARTPWTGGAPAFKPEQMSAAVVENDPILKGLYNLPSKLQFVTNGYMRITPVLGPLGELVFFGLNLKNSWTFLKDPKTPKLLKGGIVGATVLSGASAAAATRLGLSALNVAPMSTAALKSVGQFAGATMAGAGTLLSAMDTYNTFRSNKFTAAEKGFSLMGTLASGGLLVCMAAGIANPVVGVTLGVGAVAMPMLKMFLGKNKAANAVFGGIGKAASAVGHFFGGL
ncbi:MAG TPA: hypothetical protein V6D47_09995 [Oscillatoriaceae cyanobacterium]